MIITPPSYWKRQKNIIWLGIESATVWQHPLAGLQVLRSRAFFLDTSACLHISVSRMDRLPSWDELSKVKSEFIGDDVPAYHVIPARKDYVNIHKYCLHLWTNKTGVFKHTTLANLYDLIREEAV